MAIRFCATAAALLAVLCVAAALQRRALVAVARRDSEAVLRGDSAPAEAEWVEGALRSRAAAGSSAGPREASVDHTVSLKVTKKQLEADMQAEREENERLRAQVYQLESQWQAHVDSTSFPDQQQFIVENTNLKEKLDQLQAIIDSYGPTGEPAVTSPSAVVTPPLAVVTPPLAVASEEPPAATPPPATPPPAEVVVQDESPAEDAPPADHEAASEEGHTCEEGYPLPYCAGMWPTKYVYSGQFPDGFVWGVGTAAYQIEGAYREDGRGASVWDVFTGADTVGMPGANCSYCCRKAPCEPKSSMQARGATGNVADDHYHTWRSDVALMQSMGLKHYRFSISWPRLIPTGKIDDGINQKGLDFYNQLIDGLLAAGITPYATLFHWDLPQGLLDPKEGKNAWWGRDKDGVPNGEITQDFLGYADLCFSSFGDRVKMWFTFNEPWTEFWVGIAPDELGDHSTDPFIAGHNLLNAHAAAVDLYRTKYQPEQGGHIGIVLNSHWSEPKTDVEDDIQASARSVAFTLGWFADPIFGGSADYPPEMRDLIGDKLPTFTEEQKRLIDGSADFFALNHYGAEFVEGATEDEWSWNPQHAISSHGNLLRAQSDWLFAAPWALRKLLHYIDARYGHPQIYITESGWSIEANDAEAGAEDLQRVEYFANYTSELLRSIVTDGVDVRGYFAWSLVDNFEWKSGYDERFGITFRDFDFGPDPDGPREATRQPRAGRQTTRRKESSCWLERLWTTNSLAGPEKDDYGGCVDAGIFEGIYFDKECMCRRAISVQIGSVTGTQCVDEEGVCLGEDDRDWESVARANFSGGSIVMDLSDVGGLPRLRGYYRRSPPGILWEDGREWLQMEEVEIFKD